MVLYYPLPNFLYQEIFPQAQESASGVISQVVDTFQLIYIWTHSLSVFFIMK
jgi:hypothetical protein